MTVPYTPHILLPLGLSVTPLLLWKPVKRRQEWASGCFNHNRVVGCPYQQFSWRQQHGQWWHSPHRCIPGISWKQVAGEVLSTFLQQKLPAAALIWYVESQNIIFRQDLKVHLVQPTYLFFHKIYFIIQGIQLYKD